MTTDPRESMRMLPGFLQPFLTWLTGKPLPEQEPFFLWTPVTRAVWTAAVLFSGIGIGLVGLNSHGWLAVSLIGLSWLLTTGAMRMFYVCIEHVCTHGMFAKSASVNRMMGEVISTLIWATPFEVFRRDHRIHHSATRLQVDPDVQFLLGTGFDTTLSSDGFWRYLVLTILSPRYHVVYLFNRLKLNLTDRPYRIAMTIAYTGGTIAFLVSSGLWLEWLMLWFIPATVLFQISSLINYHSEHRWPTSQTPSREERAHLSYGRFCGDPVPEHGIVGWLTWVLRLIVVHIPYRIFVLVGDLPQHDLHHRLPNSDWANAAYARRNELAAAEKRKRPIGTTDVWGSMLDHLKASIEHTYQPSGAMTHATASVSPQTRDT